MVTLVSIAFLLLFYYGACKGKPILSLIGGILLLIVPLFVDVIIHEYHEVVKHLQCVEEENLNIQKQSLEGKIT